jgi:NADH-quinone oxidoreductase subunit L
LGLLVARSELMFLLVTSLLTVAYSLRAWLLVFFGAPAPAAEGAAEPGWVMRAPLLLLAVPTTLGGVAVAYPAFVLGPGHARELFQGAMAIATTVLVVLAGIAVLVVWRRRAGWDLWRPRPLPHPRADAVYDYAVVRSVRWLAGLTVVGDREVIGGYVDGAAGSAQGLGRLLRWAQNGNVQAYLMVVVVGAVAVALAAGARA